MVTWERGARGALFVIPLGKAWGPTPIMTPLGNIGQSFGQSRIFVPVREHPQIGYDPPQFG